MSPIAERLHEYDLAVQIGPPTVEILCDELTEAIAEIERLSLAESILRKLIAEGFVGAVDRGDPEYDYWPHNGDSDKHRLNPDELAYLQALTEQS